MNCTVLYGKACAGCSSGQPLVFHVRVFGFIARFMCLLVMLEASVTQQQVIDAMLDGDICDTCDELDIASQTVVVFFYF